MMNSKRFNRNGAAAVEFALVAVIAFTVILSGVELVRVNMIRHNVNNACYSATRDVIVPGATKDEAIESAEEYLSAVGVRGAQITIEPSVIDESTLFVTASIRVPMNSNSWVSAGFFKNGELAMSTTLRTERAAVNHTGSLPSNLSD